MLAHPGVEPSLDRLALRHGAGRRTLERLFRGETGISFGLWQQKARLLESIRVLAEGRSVKEIAAGFDLSVKTVEAHKFNLMRKLDIHNKATVSYTHLTLPTIYSV